jgi:hypothetical protein
LPDEVRKALEHYSSIRNTIVHDHAVYDIVLNDSMEIESSQKTCPVHHTHLEFEDFGKALSTYLQISMLIYNSIGNGVLRCNDSEEFKSIMKSFEGLLSALKEPLASPSPTASPSNMDSNG